MENNNWCGDGWQGDGWYTTRLWDGEDFDSPEKPEAFWAESVYDLEREVPEGWELDVRYYGDGDYPDEPVPVQEGYLDGERNEIWTAILGGELPFEASKTVRAKAALKALRETVGMMQRDLAEALDVDVRSVKRWESPATEGYQAPADAWLVLEEARETQRQQVAYALKVVSEQAKALGHEPGAIVLTYYRDQEQYDAGGRDSGPYGVANANARAVADALEREGYQVEWRYPDEGAIRTPGSRY